MQSARFRTSETGRFAFPLRTRTIWDYREVAESSSRIDSSPSSRPERAPFPWSRDIPSRETSTGDSRSEYDAPDDDSLPRPLDCRPRFLAPRDSPPSRPIAAMCARSRLTTSPPLRPATRASSDVHSWAVPFACAARPPLLAISFWRFASMDANPLLLFPVPDIRASIKLGSCHFAPQIPNGLLSARALHLSPFGPTLQVGAIHGPWRNSESGTLVQ